MSGSLTGIPPRAGGESSVQRWRPKSLAGLEVLSVRAAEYTYPQFALNTGYTISAVHSGTVPPVRYRRLDHPPVVAGSVIVVEPVEVVHLLETGPAPADFRSIAFLDPQRLRDATTDGELPRFGRLTYADRDLFDAVSALHDSLVRGEDELTLESRLTDMLVRLVDRHAVTPGATIQVPRPPAMRKVQQLLCERLDSNVGLDELAAVAGCSRHHLVRSFRQAYGVPPHRYRTLLRMANARTLLAAGHPAADVAARLGYFDQSLLNRHFRERFGVTAGAYARAVR